MRRKPFPYTDQSHRGSCLWVFAVLVVLFLAGCAAAPVRNTKEEISKFGMIIEDLSPQIAGDLGLPARQQGVVVLGVSRGSAAAAAGIRGGDVISGIKGAGGAFVATPRGDLFLEETGKIKHPLPVELTVLRQGKTVPVSLTRGSQPFDLAVQSSPNSEPRTFKVAADGGGDVRSLPGALLKARPGDTILLAPGKYDGVSVLLDNVTIRSEVPSKKAVLGLLMVVGASEVKVADLEFVGDANGKGGISIWKGEGNTVERCTVRGCSQGITVANSRGATIRGNRVEKNGLGIYLVDSDFDASGNLVLANTRPGGRSTGILIENSSGTVTNNTVLYQKVPFDQVAYYGGRYAMGFDATKGVGIHFSGNSNVSIESNIVCENNVGIYFAVPETARYRIEYNDVFRNISGGKKGSGNYTLTIDGPDWNYVNGVRQEEKESPVLQLFNEYRHLMFSPNVATVSPTNLSVDPLFQDLIREDYRLAADSPLVGRGRGGSYIGALPPVGRKVGEGDFK